MPPDYEVYKINSILTGQELLDLIFLETMEEAKDRYRARRMIDYFANPKYQNEQIPDPIIIDGLKENFTDFVQRAYLAGKLKTVYPWGAQNFSILKFFRDEIFQWFKSSGVLEYFKSKNIIITEEVYDLVKRYSKEEPAPVVPTAEPATSTPATEPAETLDSRNCFTRDNSRDWIIKYDGEQYFMGGGKGFLMLAYLINAAGDPVSVDDLVLCDQRPLTDLKRQSYNLSTRENITNMLENETLSIEEMLKKNEKGLSIREYDEIIKNLEEKISITDDPIDLTEAKQSLEIVKKEKSKKFNKKGKHRPIGPKENNRVNAMQTINRAIDKIKTKVPELSEHFRDAIFPTEGFEFSYSPAKIIAWKVFL